MNIIKPVILFCQLFIGLDYAYGQAKPLPKNASDTIPMKIDSLKAAIVTATLRPRMKGDTLEYNMEHILMQPNAVVEELLRRLPGLQIDANGNITYNGEKIQHLLVDGEDIFGSDPAIVTRNFDASKIARVQILDRKTDQAIFTGIDDGTRTKTLNLVMKESAKNGYFGKVEAGGNTDGYYNANGALAAFKGKEQFTALGLASNTGVLGFSSSSGGASADINFLNINTDALNASAGTGVPKLAAAALHYANTWNGQENHLVTNYQYTHYYSQPATTTQSYQTQPDSIYGQYQKSQSTNQQDMHWVRGTYDWTPTAKSALKFLFYGTNSQGQNQFGATGNSSFNGTLVNSSQRTIRDNVNHGDIGGTLIWRTQLGKSPERVFSIQTNVSKSDNTTNGYLYSLNKYYEPSGTIQSIDTTDQRKQIVDHTLRTGGVITYTEPLWKGTVAGLSYGLTHSGDEPLQATFNHGDGKYQDMVDSLSSHFKTGTITQKATVNLQGKEGHVSYTLGTDWVGYSYRQQDLLGDSVLHLHYSNLAPRAIITFTPNPSTYIRFNYSASTQQPSISQLTPTTNNNDPLHITRGNPDLKPNFSQSFHLDLRKIKTYLIDLSLNLALTSNSISTKTITDSLGRQISQPVNVDGGKTAGLNFSITRKVLGFDAGLHAAGSYSRTVNFINADLSQNDAYTGGGGFSLNKYVDGKFSLQLNTNFTYFDQVSSINTTAPVRYWTQSQQGMVAFYFIKHFEFGTNATYSWQEKTSAFGSNTAVLIWNGQITRNLAHDKLVIRLQLNNILDQSSGISRTNVNNVNTQTSTNILGRYWMLSAAWHFDHKFKKK